MIGCCGAGVSDVAPLATAAANGARSRFFPLYAALQLEGINAHADRPLRFRLSPLDWRSSPSTYPGGAESLQ